MQSLSRHGFGRASPEGGGSAWGHAPPPYTHVCSPAHRKKYLLTHTHHEIYDLRSTPIKELKEFGQGHLLYFYFLKSMAILFTVLAILPALGLAFVYGAGGWYVAQYANGLERISIGNYGLINMTGDSSQLVNITLGDGIPGERGARCAKQVYVPARVQGGCTTTSFRRRPCSQCNLLLLLIQYNGMWYHNKRFFFLLLLPGPLMSTPLINTGQPTLYYYYFIDYEIIVYGSIPYPMLHLQARLLFNINLC